ncbi:MAG TPA: pantoate--beta-alanine ligase [Actinomycetota bacterium]|nr:pantoate--beta-alanine ligase [Actinomycetota bacterium]
MRVERTVRALRAALAPERDRRVGFVPTMGALHEGHLSLLRAARAGCDTVVASIFVNPLQFGPREDFGAYPRAEERDLELARDAGVDVVFAPSTDEMYAPDHSTSIDVGPLATVLEGAARPGHFAGVCTVVAKLLNVVAPGVAYFGQKDAQQVAVIRRMARDLSFPVEIAVCPTVRDERGLALSSRNRYLSDDERAMAAALYRCLRAGAASIEGGGGPADAERAMERSLADAPGVVAEYARAVDPETFEEPGAGRPVLLAVAARVGPARLIDNLPVKGS